MGDHFFLNNGTGDNSKSKEALINVVDVLLRARGHVTISSDGPGSHLLSGSDNFIKNISAHDYLQKKAKEIADLMQGWDKSGRLIFISFSRGCMLTWHIIHELFVRDIIGVSPPNVHVLQLDPAYGKLGHFGIGGGTNRGYVMELRAGQYIVIPSNVTEVYMLNRSRFHAMAGLVDTPNPQVGINREFLPGIHEELGQYKPHFMSPGRWLYATKLQPYGRKHVTEFLGKLGVSINLEPSKPDQWLLMYTIFKMAHDGDGRKGRWGRTGRPHLKQYYANYRAENDLGSSEFFINRDDKQLFKQEAQQLFTNYSTFMTTVLQRKESRPDMQKLCLKLAVEKFMKLKTTGRNSFGQIVCASVIAHLAYRVKNKSDWPPGLKKLLRSKSLFAA